MVRSDPDTHHVDAVHAFELVLGEQTAQPALHKMLSKLKDKASSGVGLTNDVLDISKFTRVRWKGNAGRESIVAPLHAVVQALMMVNSSKTKAVRATAAKTTLRAAGGDQTLVAEVQQNADRLGGTVTQRVLLADTQSSGSSSSFAPASEGVLSFIDRMPEGPERMTLIMKGFEEAKARERKQQEEEDEHRRENHERRLAVYNEDIAKIRDKRLQNRKRSEAELTELNQKIKDRAIDGLTGAIATCNNPRQIETMQAKLDMWSSMGTAQVFAHDSKSTEAPVPLAQAVIAKSNGTISDVRLPANVSVIHVDTNRYLTLQEFMPLWWSEDKLTPAQLSALGREVAKEHNQIVANGRAVPNRSFVDGVQHASRSYLLFELTQPPLHAVIERFILNLRKANQEAARGTKRKAMTMDSFVVQGVPLQ